METLKIRKSIAIDAPKENVWNVLLDDKFNKIWFSEFGEGIYAETDWKVGSKAKFTDTTGGGIVGRVIVNQANEVLCVEYTGIVVSGKEDYESDIAKQVKGGKEIYHLSQKEGVTDLSIECDMSEEYFTIMSSAWDRALEKIKELSLRK